jgi:non-ribosomal peptide synthetase-like protein
VRGRCRDAAPAPRTPVDVLASTVASFPDADAIDDGARVLTYRQLQQAVAGVSDGLRARGVHPGDRVGIRIPSGSADLYLAILGVLSCGASYVPVDADDPQERADLIFGEAAANFVLDPESLAALADVEVRRSPRPVTRPTPEDDAWIIFTSGSTGTPKGVAVSHRSAAAFVDAEAGLFLPEEPIAPGDRVLAGLSVAFDASCEEMWLAWRHGACLVPAPRSLVRSGMDLGPWLLTRRITVVSTVPTLAALWPQESLDGVRLLIFGGEACPPELADRLVDDGREVWNTYGPTEATVVACAAKLVEDEPIRIGLPLDGWELAVVDDAGQQVAEGQIGELIIGGVGLARYLDPDKDAEKFAAMRSLGWDRAYRSGDLVVADSAGLFFRGRADDQVKLGGRRIELGEVDAALQALPRVVGAAAAVRRTPGGSDVLVGYLVTAEGFDPKQAREQLRAELPASLVPMLAEVDTLPVRTSGKVDRDALPWPLPGLESGSEQHSLTGTAGWLADRWSAILGAPVTGLDDDFFAHGGGSLTAARLVSTLRGRFPAVTVAELYEHPRLGDLADHLDAALPSTEPAAPWHRVRPTPRISQLAQLVVTVVVNTLRGLSWLTGLLLLGNLLRWDASVSWVPHTSWWLIAGGFVVFVSPFGRIAITVIGARLLLVGVRPGVYRRGGGTHLRLWSAERLADAVGAVNLAGAPWISYYARALGAKVARDVDLHSVPPITGMLTLGRGCAVEPEVDLTGYWVDGDRVHIGRVEIGAGASVGSRSTLGPGARIGRDAVVEPGSFLDGAVPDGETWGGAPANLTRASSVVWPAARPPRAGRWVAAYAIASALFALLPLIALVPGLLFVRREVRGARNLESAFWAMLAAVPVVTVTWFVGYALLVAVIVRLLGIGLDAGQHAVRSRIGWQAWGTERLMDAARALLFPLYSSLLTPAWLRLLGAKVGSSVEASTVLAIPSMTTVNDGAFLADDTMVASYELHGGWLRIEPVKIGKRAFLGNSGMAAPGRNVPKNALVAVLSAAPGKSKKGSSWLGSPPVKLRRQPGLADRSRTFAPPLRLKVGRAVVELCRIVPTMVTFALGGCVLAALQSLRWHHGVLVAALFGGVVLLGAGFVAGAVTSLAKWVLVGRVSVSEHTLWSSFVWRNEVMDTFVEMVAAPWFARAATGTSVLNLWLRSLGAQLGRGVWCETYWLPEADLVRLGAGATVNRGCVLQTHLFHDRIMQLDRVDLAPGATLGPHGVILPAASIGPDATVGPASLLMRGEAVPGGTRWIGNPVSPWRTTRPASVSAASSAASKGEV